MPLDSFLPEYDFREFHQARVPAPASCVFRAVKEMTAGELPVMTILMLIRSFPACLVGRSRVASASGRRVLEEFINAGFFLLAEQRNHEIVVGRIGQFWKLTGGEFPSVTDLDAFIAFDRRGFVKVAANFASRNNKTAQRE